MDELIPARGGKNREMLDSAFLLKYARRIEGRAKWMMTTYALWGALVGFGVGSAFVAVQGFVRLLTGPRLSLGALFGQPEAVPVEAMVFGLPVVWIPLLSAMVGAVIWATRGLGKSDEMRFNAQMALHVLKLQELVMQERENG